MTEEKDDGQPEDQIVLLAQVGVSPRTGQMMLGIQNTVSDRVVFCLELAKLAASSAQKFFVEREQAKIAVPKLHLPKNLRGKP